MPNSQYVQRVRRAALKEISLGREASVSGGVEVEPALTGDTICVPAKVVRAVALRLYKERVLIAEECALVGMPPPSRIVK
jgi:hypothetical protein